MPLKNRGGQRIDQTSTGDLSGGVNSGQFATTDTAAKANNHIAVWENGNVIDTGVDAGANAANYIVERLAGANGVNVDFFTTFIPVSPPTGTPPMVPFDLVVNTRSLSPYIPNYSLAPGSNHVIFLVPPQTGDDLFCRYFAVLPAANRLPAVLPPAAPGVQVRSSSTQTDTAASTVVTWPLGTAAGDTVMILVGESPATATPAGWTRIGPTGAGSWHEMVIYKTLTAADVTAGSITIVW